MKELRNFLLTILLAAAGGASVSAMDFNSFQGENLSAEEAEKLVIALSIGEDAHIPDYDPNGYDRYEDHISEGDDGLDSDIDEDNDDFFESLEDVDPRPDIIKKNTSIDINEWKEMSAQNREEWLTILTMSATDSGSSGNSPQQNSPRQTTPTTQTNIGATSGQEEVVAHECVICLCEIENGDAMALICGHVFHKDCVEQALRFKDLCPVCKTKQNLQDEIAMASREKAGFEDAYGDVARSMERPFNPLSCPPEFNRLMRGSSFRGTNLRGRDLRGVGSARNTNTDSEENPARLHRSVSMLNGILRSECNAALRSFLDTIVGWSMQSEDPSSHQVQRIVDGFRPASVYHVNGIEYRWDFVSEDAVNRLVDLLRGVRVRAASQDTSNEWGAWESWRNQMERAVNNRVFSQVLGMENMRAFHSVIPREEYEDIRNYLIFNIQARLGNRLVVQGFQRLYPTNVSEVIDVASDDELSEVS